MKARHLYGPSGPAGPQPHDPAFEQTLILTGQPQRRTICYSSPVNSERPKQPAPYLTSLRGAVAIVVDVFLLSGPKCSLEAGMDALSESLRQRAQRVLDVAGRG